MIITISRSVIENLVQFWYTPAPQPDPESGDLRAVVSVARRGHLKETLDFAPQSNHRNNPEFFSDGLARTAMTML